MPDIRLGTSATVEIVPQLGLDGAQLLVVVIKELFHVDPRGDVVRVGGAEVRYADVPWTEDPPAVPRLPTDVCTRKPGTDVIVVADAVGRGMPRVETLDVLVRVGTLEKILRVFGPRVWYRGPTGINLTGPDPFESLPLRWDFAFGGFDDSDSDKPPVEEPRNPVGRGIAADSKSLIHQPGPQIEDPRHLISSSRDRPPPAGVAAIGRHWQPRRSYTGTMDEQWMNERMPLLPADFDDRFNQCATPDLISPVHLRGGELVQLHNVSIHGPLSFPLPRLAFFVGSYTLDHGMAEHRAVLDTVILQPTVERTVELTWRAVVPMPRRVNRLRYIQVHEKAVL